jgi:hypothetical protein
VDAVHPLDLYVGLDRDSKRELLLIASTVPRETARRFRAFDVLVGSRSDGRDYFSIKLRRSELGRLFSHLCDDLVEASRGVRTEPEGVTFVRDRISRWEHLLSRQRGNLLDHTTVRGLLGELLFLKHYAIPKYGPVGAVRAWKGPLGASHDFHFPECDVEVKSVTATLIAQITSLEQLAAGEEPLFLTAVILLETAVATSESFSLTTLITSLRDTLAADQPASDTFNDKLHLVGYSDIPDYERTYFTLDGMQYYEVHSTFPRLLSASIPAALIVPNYAIDLRRCDSFRRAELCT